MTQVVTDIFPTIFERQVQHNVLVTPSEWLPASDIMRTSTSKTGFNVTGLQYPTGVIPVDSVISIVQNRWFVTQTNLNMTSYNFRCPDTVGDQIDFTSYPDTTDGSGEFIDDVLIDIIAKHVHQFTDVSLTTPDDDLGLHTENLNATGIALLQGAVDAEVNFSIAHNQINGGNGGQQWKGILHVDTVDHHRLRVTFVLPPTIISILPISGDIAGGTAVTITGTDFVGSGSAGVTFDGLAATSVIFVNDTTITCLTPAHAAGSVDIVVTNNNEKADTLVNGYEYVVTDPTLVSIDPTSGPTSGGTSVTLTGTDFDDTGALEDVTFDGVSATSIVFVNSTTITCITPAGTVGFVDVVVTNGGGQSDTLINGFEYTSKPTKGFKLAAVGLGEVEGKEGPGDVEDLGLGEIQGAERRRDVKGISTIDVTLI